MSNKDALVPTQQIGLIPTLTRDQTVQLQEALATLWRNLPSPESQRGYRDDWRRWCEWTALQGFMVLEARPLDVLHYLEGLHQAGRAKATRARALAVIRQTYGALVVAELCKTNPAREVKNIKVSADPRTPWLSEDELRGLLAQPKNPSWVTRRDWLICATLAGTALRRSEIARLARGKCIRVPGGLVAQVRTKGDKEAFIVFPNWLSTEIDRWCVENQITGGPIFPRRRGADKPIGATTVRNAVKRTAEHAGINLERATPHAIRRSFATITGQRGVSLEDRQAAMLHSSKTTTERYDKAARLPETAPGEVLRDLVGSYDSHGSPPTSTWPPRRSDYEK